LIIVATVTKHDKVDSELDVLPTNSSQVFLRDDETRLLIVSSSQQLFTGERKRFLGDL